MCQVPEKYHSTYFVIDMLVSCRHRFQKPSAAYFWSKQSEALIMCTFRQTASLARLVLPLCNDMLLKAIAVYCRNRAVNEISRKFSQYLILEEGLCLVFTKGFSLLKASKNLLKDLNLAFKHSKSTESKKIVGVFSKYCENYRENPLTRLLQKPA